MIEVSSFGIDEVNEILQSATDRESTNLLRSTVQRVASDMAKEMKRRVPQDSRFLKRQIHAKRRKVRNNMMPVSEVIFHRRGQRAAYYWRFVEYGQGGQSAKPFVRPVIEMYKPMYPQKFNEAFLVTLQKRIERQLRQQQRRSS